MVETNDAQTTRRPPMVHLDPDGQGVVYLWPNYGSGFQTFYTSPQSRSYPCLIRVVPYGFMVYLDPGARYMVYLQPQQRMVPAKSPLQISNKNIIFSFHKSLFKKALLSHFLGQQRGYPRMISFLCPFQGFPQVQYSCKTLKMLTAPNMDPQTLKTQVLYSLTKKSRNKRCTNNKKASHGSPRPWW